MNLVKNILNKMYYVFILNTVNVRKNKITFFYHNCFIYLYTEDKRKIIFIHFFKLQSKINFIFYVLNKKLENYFKLLPL
jgi:hypothetical protein